PVAGWSLPGAFAARCRRLEKADLKGGTRQYIQVLRLLETYDLAAVTGAAERALALAGADADAVGLLLERPGAAGGGLRPARVGRNCWRSACRPTWRRTAWCPPEKRCSDEGEARACGRHRSARASPGGPAPADGQGRVRAGCAAVYERERRP